MLSNIGIPSLVLIIFILLIFFGPNKLPQLGRSLGTTLKEFKDSTKGIAHNDEDEVKFEQSK